jgi:alpha-1,2-mannosyltransferase
VSDLQHGLLSGTWLTPQRIAGYAVILLIAYAALFVWLFATSHGVVDSLGRPLGTDFANIWSSGRMVLEGRAAEAFDPALQRLYQQAATGQDPEFFFGWHYPPMFLAVAAVLATLPYLPALLVWVIVTTALYAVVMRLIVGDAVPTRLALLSAVAYPAVFANATHGHNGTLSAVLLGLGLLLLRDRPVQAGVCIGLLAFKPQYGVFIPIVLLIAGQWRAIGAATLTVIATVGASIALFGLESWTAFFTHAAFTKSVVLESGAAGWGKLQGVFPTVRMWGGSTAVAYSAQGLFMLAVLAALIWLWSSPARFEQKAAGLVLATMLATPYSFNYDTVILAVALAWLVRDGFSHGFAPYEASLLALLWVAPLVSRELTTATHVPFALLVHSAVFAHVVFKARRAAALQPVGHAYASQPSPSAA